MQTAPSIPAPKAQRNYGIDLLRIVSMLMIIVLHLLGHGGILKNTVPFSYRYEVAWFMETASYCAVNCYAIISGYVAVKSKFKYSNIAYLWFQVAFYTGLISVIMAIISPNIGKAEVIYALHPVSNRIYWYFTAYFCIYFFTPIFQKAIDALSEKQLKAIGTAIFMIFCVIPFIAEKDPFALNRGYTPIWLMMLYILGGIINKCNIFSKMKSGVLILLYLLMVVITWAERYICEYVNTYLEPTEPLKIKLTSYISPTIFFAAIFLVVGFSKLNIGKMSAKLIAFFAPASFSVYLIHENPYVRENVIKRITVDFPKFNSLLLVVSIIATMLAIYLVCTFIDTIREWIFKMLRIKKLLVYLETKFIKNIW